jgi:phage baseplate assembly protein W
MQITINTENVQLDWAAKGIDRIAQNVHNLITTKKYEVAYDRTLGINPSFIDQPFQTAISEMTAQIYEIISEREPRVTIVSVEYISVDIDGNMQIKVVIEIE